MQIQVFVADEQDDRPVDADAAAELARRVLDDRGVPAPAELNVLFVDEHTIATLNSRFLGRQGPTDVLSFAIEDDVLGAPPPRGSPDPSASGPGRPGRTGLSAEPFEGALEATDDEMPLLVGDVVICPEVAYRNAPSHSGSYEDELALLLVHGVLHLLGMDHERRDEAEAMEALERELLERHHRPRPRPAERPDAGGAPA